MTQSTTHGILYKSYLAVGAIQVAMFSTLCYYEGLLWLVVFTTTRKRAFADPFVVISNMFVIFIPLLVGLILFAKYVNFRYYSSKS